MAKAEYARWWRQFGLVIALCAALSAVGCFSFSSRSRVQTDHSIVHVVQPGETLYRIAKRYGISQRVLMRANRLTNPHDLRVGQKLLVPVGGSSLIASNGRYRNLRLGRSGSPPADGRQFKWPITKGTVTSGFGVRDGAMHDGIDIAAQVGTPIHAADDGVVIFAGRLRGYGRVIILQHDQRYVTIYGHNEKIDVREGDHVVSGQTIGLVGTSGRTTGPNLHFEVRRNNVAYDPLYYLPAPSPWDRITFARSGGS